MIKTSFLFKKKRKEKDEKIYYKNATQLTEGYRTT